MHAGVWDKSADGAPRGPRPDARHRRLRQHRHPAVGARREPRACGCSSTTPPTSWRWATPGAAPSLEELLDDADVVTLHVDGRPGNASFFGDERVRRDAPGRAVPQPLARLRRRLRGAARAHRVRPPRRRGRRRVPASSRRAAATSSSPSCAGLPNVILTPHIGGSTEEAQQDIGRFVAAQVPRLRRRRHRRSMSVNMPGLALPPAPEHAPADAPAPQRPRRAGDASTACSPSTTSTSRRQLLGTRGEIGYVVTDISGQITDDVITRLRELPNTIRLRIV